jgi:hypothetical protein
MAAMTNSRQVADDRHAGADRALDLLGLAPIAADLYRVLVAHPGSTATELSERCAMSPQQATRLLSRLAGEGLASRLPGRRARYVAVAPDVTLGALLGRKESELGAARVAVRELSQLYQEAARHTNPAAAVEVVTGRENIGRRVDHMHSTVRETFRGFDRAPYVRPVGFDGTAEMRRLREGVEYRVIYEHEAISIPGRMRMDIQPAVARGEQARVRPDLPTKLLIADDRLALLPTGDSQTTDVAYLVRPSGLLDALIRLFEAEWELAVPVTTPTARGARPHADRGPQHDAAPVGESLPDEDSATLLTLLAAGQTDAAIARSLSWSLRTTQRRVRQLMRDLNATTRFQAGIAARDRGWL